MYVTWLGNVGQSTGEEKSKLPCAEPWANLGLVLQPVV